MSDAQSKELCETSDGVICSGKGEHLLSVCQDLCQLLNTHSFIVYTHKIDICHYKEHNLDISADTIIQDLTLNH